MRRSLPALTVAVLLVLGTSACGDQAPPRNEGSGQSVPLAGLGPQIEAAGVEVVATERPAGADGAAVAAALGDAGLTVADDAVLGRTEVAEPLGIDGEATAGLVTAVLPDPASGSVAVLVFAARPAAAVFASAPPTAVEAGDDRVLLLAGNLVAVSDPASAADVRAALSALAGTATPDATPSGSASPTS